MQLTACRMFLEERSTTFLFMAHSSSHSKMAFWGQTHKQLHYSFTTRKRLKREKAAQERTLKYIGAMSPSSRGSGMHSRTMCRRWRGLRCTSMNTQSRSWDSNIRTRARRNSWAPHRGAQNRLWEVQMVSFYDTVSNCPREAPPGSPGFRTTRPHPVQWQSSGAGGARWDSVPPSWTPPPGGLGTPGYNITRTGL